MSEWRQWPIVPGDREWGSPGGQPRVRGRQHGRCAEVGLEGKEVESGHANFATKWDSHTETRVAQVPLEH